MTRYETWDAINQGDPYGRIAVAKALAEAPGKQLVFVHYWPPHTFEEWVYNAADIDSSRVVWARDLGPIEDQRLRAYYPDRYRVAAGAGFSSSAFKTLPRDVSFRRSRGQIEPAAIFWVAVCPSDLPLGAVPLTDLRESVRYRRR